MNNNNCSKWKLLWNCRSCPQAVLPKTKQWFLYTHFCTEKLLKDLFKIISRKESVSFYLFSGSCLKSVVLLGSLSRSEPWNSSPRIFSKPPGISLFYVLAKPRATHTALASKHWNLAALNLALGNLRSHFHFSYKSTLWIESIKDLMFSTYKWRTEHWWLASNNPTYCKIIKYLVNTRKLNYIKSLQLKQGYFLDFCLYLIFRLWQ